MRKSKEITFLITILVLFRLYIFGGHDIREGSLSNLWMLDLSKLNDLETAEENQ